MPDSAELVLGRKAVAAGLLDEAGLAACLAVQAAARAAGGAPRSLLSLLVARGRLTREQLLALLDPALREQLARDDVEAGGTIVPGRAAAGAPEAPSRAVPSPPVVPPASASTATCVAGVPPAPSAPAAPDTPAPRMFGRYRLDGEVARGGMGIVYRAFDTQVKRTVALKVMLWGDDAAVPARRRFEREALAAARLSHPNIVPVFDVGEVDGKLYYTMELIAGESVAAVLRRMQTVPPRAALKIARDAARALQYAHEQHLVHRDIKPANLLLATESPNPAAVPAERDSTLNLAGSRTASFRVVLTDFGLARDLASESHLTRTGDVLGTPMYMSPEQAGGDPAGPASDVYSLGSVLYEMLCGAPPFAETNAVRLLAALLLEDPPPLRRRAPALSPDLETLVAKAMEKDPGRRYASARAFADDLDRYLAGEVILARPSSRAYRAWRRVVRHREAVGALAVLGILLASAIIAGPLRSRYVDWRAARDAAQELAERRTVMRSLLAQAEANLAAGRTEPVIADLSRVAGRPESELAGLEDLLPEVHDLLARTWATQGDTRRALLERYRAYRRTLGRPDADAFLLRAARELVHQLQYAEALPLLARVARQSRTEAVRAEADFWRGRALAGTLDFTGAAAALARATAAPALPADLRTEAARHQQFCAALADRSVLPFRATDLVVAGPAAERPRTLVGLDGGQLFLGTLDGAAWHERARLDLETAGSVRADRLAVLGVPDAAHPLFAVAGGIPDQGKGVVWFVRRDGDALRLAARLPVEGIAKCFACADLDGDGRPEILVGTGWYERRVRVYDWPEGQAAPRLRTAFAAPGDVHHLEPVTLGGDGRAALVAFLGPWGGYGACVLRWDPGRRELVAGPRTSFGIPGSVCRLDRPGRAPLFAVGVEWQREMAVPLRKSLGAEKFEATVRPPGPYLLDLQPDQTFRVTPIGPAESWASGDQGWCSVERVRGPAGDFLWCSLVRQGESDQDWELRTVTRVYSVGDYTRPCATFVHDREAPDSPGAWSMRARDLDGDGWDEPVLRFGTGQSLVGLLPEGVAAAAAGRAVPDPDVPAAEPAAVATSSARLDYAAAAERVGLLEEALSAYAEAARESKEILAIEAATRGNLRCLVRLGREKEVSAAARAAAARFPQIETPLLREAVRLLDAGRCWGPAAEVAARLLQAADLDTAARAEAGEQVARFRALAEMPQRVRLIGGGAGAAGAAAAVDWLATSPLLVARGSDGAWTVYAWSDGKDRLLVPFANAASSWQLAGTVRVVRQDWKIDFRVGAGAFDPFAAFERFPCLHLLAEGETTLPLYTLSLESPPTPSQSLARSKLRALERGDPPDAPLAFELGLVAHQSRLVARLRGGYAAGRGHACELEAPVPQRPPLLVGFQVGGGSPPGYRGVFSVDELELRADSPATAPLEFRPVAAAEYLMLANGRWIQGRAADARALYDRAVTAADAERTQAETLVAQGLPAAWDRPSPNGIVRWAAVDARFYRGLLRGATGDAAGAGADLQRAWQLSAARCQELLRRYALPLQERPQDAGTLSAFWRERSGNPAPEQRVAWAQETVRTLGAEAAEVVIPGLTVRNLVCLRVRKLQAGGPAERAGLQAGDLIVAADGAPVAGLDDLKKAVGAAAQAGHAQVGLDVVRLDRVERVPVPCGPLGVEVESVPWQEIRFAR